jgi:hypothetical protein
VLGSRDSREPVLEFQDRLNELWRLLTQHPKPSEPGQRLPAPAACRLTGRSVRLLSFISVGRSLARPEEFAQFRAHIEG